MKSFRGILVMMLALLAPHLLCAQEAAISVQEVNAMSDTEVMLRAIESVPPLPAASLPRSGTFYSAAHAPGSRSPWPPLPGNIYGLPVWDLGDGVYLLDDAGENDSPAMMPMVGGLLPPGYGDGVEGGTNTFYSDSFNPPIYTTNDLWLSMNGVTNAAAYMTIHPPWTVTNGVWDLYYTTDLSTPETWTWVMRSFAGETNLVAGNATDAQGFYKLGPPDDLASISSLGTNFWVAFFTMDAIEVDYYYVTNRELWLYISSPVGASGVVTVPGLGITNTFTVAAGAVTNISITNKAMMGGEWGWDGYGYYLSEYDPHYFNSDVIESNGIHVTASQPVSVYGFYYEPALSAAFTCYPTTLLGTNYCLMAHSGNAYPAYSQFAIVATEDNTTVHVNPSATAGLVKYVDDQNNGYAYTVTNLQQGQTYEIESANENGDVTGTEIQSDKPIAVFAGADVAYVPSFGDDNAAENPLVQEQLPVKSWGTMALALSFAGRENGDTYRVLAAYSNTVVTITGTIVTPNNSDVMPWTVTTNNEVLVVTNQAGQFFETNIDGPVVFQATQPIQVAQFANGCDFDEIYDPHSQFPEGDPCEILLPSVGHYFRTNTVFAPVYNSSSTGDFDEHFLNIIVPQSALTSTFVDGSIITTNNFIPIGSSGYYGARLSVASVTHKVTSSLPVGVEVYGFGGADTYGYFGGVVK